ncbi:MAG: alkaline phosphatase family protein [Candidatus Diapherotrites archaeon]
MRKIFVVIDGLGDKRIKGLGNRTPLEYANTPNMDFFAEKGANGRIITVRKDIAPESDVAIMALLGFDPFKYHCGRGPLEAYGCGMKVREGDLCLRANFASVEGNKIIDRRAGRALSTKEATILSKELNSKIKLKERFEFRNSVEHRGALIIRKGKKRLSDEISNTDPAYERVKGLGVASSKKLNELIECRPLNKSSEAKYSAELVNDFSFQAENILGQSSVNKKRIKNRKMPANYVLLRDAGIRLPEFPWSRRKWASIAGMPLEIALTELTGMKVFSFRYPELKPKQELYENLLEKLSATANASKKTISREWNNFDGFYVHFKETDIPGHDGLSEEKIKMIELIDREFFSWMKKKVGLGKDRVIVTADHCTPCELRNHSADAVPVLIAGKGVEADSTKEFSEFNKGRLGLIKGKNLFGLIEKLKI